MIHGIQFDIIRMIAVIPEDRIHKAKEGIDTLLMKKFFTIVNLQKVIGLLNFCCKCIKPGPAFLRRLWDLTCRDNSNSSLSKFNFVHLSYSSKQDLLA